jgi:IS5 family transposase
VGEEPDEIEGAGEGRVFQVMKLKFGFVKVRYRGLKKNAHRLFVTCALVNLFMSRKKVLLAAA